MGAKKKRRGGRKRKKERSKSTEKKIIKSSIFFYIFLFDKNNLCFFPLMHDNGLIFYCWFQHTDDDVEGGQG
jgi:hypothetical protein